VAVVTMSKREFDQLETLLGVQSGRLRVADACALLGRSRRQVFHLLRGVREAGASSLVSKRRGRPSNRRLPDAVRQLAMSLVRERYADFGPTLAAEKLAELHGCTVSRETLRGWMVADGLWLDRRARLPSPHQPRRRRECLGELVQIDGSEHAWFEGRGPGCTLLAFVDDATSRLMLLRFVPSESAFSYFGAVRAYLGAHGKHARKLAREPVAFYSDKHGVFQVNRPGTKGDEVTQFGRALCELNVERRRSPDIDIICANSPQAKGRVERAFGTLQDQLVKELRLAGITGVEAGNAWLPGFVAGYNARFGRQPSNAKDLHRPVLATDDLDEVLAWREERTVTANLVLHYDRMMLLLEPTAVARGLARNAAGRQRTVNNLEAPGGSVRHRPQCHLYFARAMTSLPCADMCNQSVTYLKYNGLIALLYLRRPPRQVRHDGGRRRCPAGTAWRTEHEFRLENVRGGPRLRDRVAGPSPADHRRRRHLPKPALPEVERGGEGADRHHVELPVRWFRRRPGADTQPHG